MKSLSSARKQNGPAIFALGFRPFFLLAGVFAGLVLLLWLGVLFGNLGISPAYPAHYCHAQEMIFGYGSAVIVGFLLTASKNWK